MASGKYMRKLSAKSYKMLSKMTITSHNRARKSRVAYFSGLQGQREPFFFLYLPLLSPLAGSTPESCNLPQLQTPPPYPATSRGRKGDLSPCLSLFLRGKRTSSDLPSILIENVSLPPSQVSL
jgi:hypothetical protein